MNINILIIIVAFTIEIYNKKNNKKTPLHTIPLELFLLFITLFIRKNNNSDLIKYPALMAFWLHLARLIIYNKELLKIKLAHQIIGAFSVALLLSKHTFFLEPIFRLIITYKNFNLIGFNFLVDIPVIIYQIYMLLFNYDFLSKESIILNFWKGNLIYHLLEFFSYIKIKYLG